MSPRLIIALCIAITVILALPAFAESLNPSRLDVKKIVVEEALKENVPPPLALAVAKIESDFDNRALSKAGARGVMQIMPATARGVFKTDPDALWDPRVNARLGTRFLRQLYETYGKRWDLALSHYNAGTLPRKGAIAIPHDITKSYIQKVSRWRQRYAEQASVWRVAVTPSIFQSRINAAPVQPPSNRLRSRFISPSNLSASRGVHMERWQRPATTKVRKPKKPPAATGSRLRQIRRSLDDFNS